jgi:hypothetical protein
MDDDAFARSSQAHRSRRSPSLVRPEQGWVPDDATVAERRKGLAALLNSPAEETPKPAKSFTRVGLALIAESVNQNGQTIKEYAEKLNKTTRTISDAVKRMTRDLKRKGLRPIFHIAADPGDRRCKQLWLYDDWKERLAEARPHLVTDGIGVARKIAHAHERKARAMSFLPHAKTQEEQAFCQKVIQGADRVLEWNEGPTQKAQHSGGLGGNE